MSAPRPHARRTASKARRRRPLVLALAAAGALTLSLSACSAGAGGDAAADGPVTLDFWTYSVKGNDPKAQAIVDRYNELNPDVTVKLSEVGGTADTSSKLLAADRADETPDIVQVEYRALPSLVVAGVVKDITDDVADAKGDVADNIWDLWTFDDRVYGVPQDIGPAMFTYRKDLLEQYGVEVPTTWAEYADAAEKIHTADPTVYISSFDPGEFQFFAAQAAQAGAEWWTNDGDTWKVGIDSEESLATADFWQDLVERDLVKVEALVTPEWNAEINDGKVLSWAAASWVPSVINAVAPDTAGKWESAPLPQWTEGDASVPFIGGSAYFVPEKSSDSEAAAKFATWLSTSDEGSKLLLTLDLYPGGNGGREATAESSPPALMPDQADFYQIADQVIEDTTIPVTWGPNVNVAQTVFNDAMNAAALNGTSFRDVYTATQDAVVADLKKTGYSVKE